MSPDSTEKSDDTKMLQAVSTAQSSGNEELSSQPTTRRMERKKGGSARKRNSYSSRSSKFSILPSKPRSKYDLSASSIAFTAPLYQVRLVTPSSLLCEGLTRIMVEELISVMESMEPSVTNCLSVLPKDISHVRMFAHHLYRNFSDCLHEIRNRRKSANPRLMPISRREMDIMAYFIAKNKGHESCHFLMPYREKSDMWRAYVTVKQCQYQCDKTYMDHVNHCVEGIIRLECEILSKEETAALQDCDNCQL